ncbi:MAG TPA: nucleotide sugar dehydrogenase [Methanomicrobiales archaeon]|nr:nucleotide sugar dehydrogenase [Methanomicrobiales archaeon]
MRLPPKMLRRHEVMTGDTVSIIGLGKLGASMAAAMASRGLKVIGVDVVPRAVELLNQGKPPVVETDLAEYITRHRKNLEATADYRHAVQNSDITFVIVPTPSDERGAFSIKYAISAFQSIGEALREKDGYHTIVLTSTVLPGSTRFGLLPVLEEASGKKCGKDFGLCYSPEFIALGSVIHDFLNPDFLLIGEFDKKSGDMLTGYYSRIMENNPPVKRMSIENAELTKISLNSYVTMKITFANMVSALCERIPGGDVDVVTDALGLDRRIGRRYLTGGLGFGGHCFPRDNIALAFLARSLGVSHELLLATDHFNKNIPGEAVKKLGGLIKPGMTVGILGLSYKPLSCVVEESQGILLAESLAAHDVKVLGYDPLAREEVVHKYLGKIEMVYSLQECIDSSDVVFITTPDPAFKDLRKEDFSRGRNPKVVVDFWRMLKGELEGGQVKYIQVGTGEMEGEALENLENLWR